MRLVNWCNYVSHNTYFDDGVFPGVLLIGEENTAPSKTVPGMTLSLQELLKKYVRGENVTTFEPVFDSDSDLPDVSKLDALERLDMARNLREFVSDEQAKRSSAVQKSLEKADAALKKAALSDAPSDIVDVG